MLWGRRLYYRDSYGRVRQDRGGGHQSGPPGKWALIALLVLAGLMVLASLLQSGYHAVTRGLPRPDQISSSASTSSIAAAGSGAGAQVS
jgi:hypothetical protein